MNPLTPPPAVGKIDWVRQRCLGNQSRRSKTLNLNLLNPAKKLTLDRMVGKYEYLKLSILSAIG